MSVRHVKTVLFMKSAGVAALAGALGCATPGHAQTVMHGTTAMDGMDMSDMNGTTEHSTAATPPKSSATAAASMPSYIDGVMPVMDQGIWVHGLLDEFEGRLAGRNSSFRWDGQAWVGGDYNRLWLRSEGTVTRGRMGDGDQELLYSRSISTYFDVQGGVRVDLDSGPTRSWGAFGIQGLALYQFELQATGYVSDRGQFAGRFEGSYDILLTNRLILQPQVELNLYSKADKARGNGAGLSDIDTGLRLRYEVWRKFAPYIALTYDGYLQQARRFAHQRDDSAGSLRLTIGIRSWF